MSYKLSQPQIGKTLTASEKRHINKKFHGDDMLINRN